MSPEQEIIRGNDAAGIVNHPLYREAIKGVRESIVSSMARSPLGDAETHNRLVIALQLLGQIEKSLADVMQTGQMAELQVKDKRKLFG
jgi:hypothetical protein